MSGSLLEVRDLKKSFVIETSIRGRILNAVRAVDGVSFDLNKGETLGLVGESGCGKSTVGRLILRLLEPTGGGIFFEGKNILVYDTAELRRFRAHAQLIFQDPYASLNPRMTVGSILDEPLKLHTDLGKKERLSRVGQLLGLVGLKQEHTDRYPHEFSGGQRQRIAIARALAVNPSLIVCDEAVSALDVSIRAQIINLLKDLQQQLGIAYLFISHDISVVNHVADRVAVMYLGRIVEIGKAADVLSEPRHPYTQALLSAVPLPQVESAETRPILPGDPPSPLTPPTGCHLHPRCPYAVEICRTQTPLLTEDSHGHTTACHIWESIDARRTRPHMRPGPAHLEKLIAAFTAGTG
jgi:peptide/nickel transport system ATP-binding protein/oligopeptide transport system ATP-binding protein